MEGVRCQISVPEVDDHNLVELGAKLLTARGIEGKLRPVNRLDRGTSGAIIMAKSATAAGMFGPWGLAGIICTGTYQTRCNRSTMTRRA